MVGPRERRTAAEKAQDEDPGAPGEAAHGLLEDPVAHRIVDHVGAAAVGQRLPLVAQRPAAVGPRIAVLAVLGPGLHHYPPPLLGRRGGSTGTPRTLLH